MMKKNLTGTSLRSWTTQYPCRRRNWSSWYFGSCSSLCWSCRNSSQRSLRCLSVDAFLLSWTPGDAIGWILAPDSCVLSACLNSSDFVGKRIRWNSVEVNLFDHDRRVVSIPKDGVGEPSEEELHIAISSPHVCDIIIFWFVPVGVQGNTNLTWKSTRMDPSWFSTKSTIKYEIPCCVGLYFDS